MRNLNMWQRLGVVASILWTLAGGLWELTSRSDTANRMVQLSYSACLGVEPGMSHPEICSSEMPRNIAIWREGIWGDVAVFAFGPVLLAWFVAYLAIWIGRWVLTGRRRPS